MSHDDIFRSLRVGTPCPMRFEDLEGDGARRWCGECRLHVYDFAQLSRSEVVRLVETNEGRLCGRIVRRADGTVVTKDCGPVRRRRVRLGAAAAALLATLAPFGLTACARGTGEEGGTEGPAGTPAQVDPDPEAPALLGEICVPEELGDVAIDPTELPQDTPQVAPRPQELLGRIVVPPRPVEEPEDTTD